MAIRILVTGGTFDKDYNELTGQLFFKDTHIAEMLRLGRSRVQVTIRTVMMVDSLEMTEVDRALIVQNCLSPGKIASSSPTAPTPWPTPPPPSRAQIGRASCRERVCYAV